MSVTLTDEQAAERLKDIREAHRGFDPRCTHREDCIGCRSIAAGIVALYSTREPAPAAGCQHRELLEWAVQKYISDELPLGLRLRIKAVLQQPCAAPGEPSQEDFDGMQRWLDDALRTCRDDDHKRLKYLQADVRILAAARRWVARAAPGEAGELIDDTRPAGIASFEDHVKAAVRDLNRGAVRWVIRWLQTLKAAPAPAPSEAGELVHEQEALYQGGDELADGRLLVTMRLRRDDVIRVYRRRAPEREGGDPDVR